MKKVITSDDVNRARKAGQTRLTLSPGGLVTPQARDDAKDYGIEIVQAVSAQAASRLPETASARLPGKLPREASGQAPGQSPMKSPIESPAERQVSRFALSALHHRAGGAAGHAPGWRPEQGSAAAGEQTGPIERFRAASIRASGQAYPANDPAYRASAEDKAQACTRSGTPASGQAGAEAGGHGLKAEEAVRRIAARMSLEGCRSAPPACPEAGVHGKTGERNAVANASASGALPASGEAWAPPARQTAAASAPVGTSMAYERQPELETEKLVSIIMEVISEFYPGYGGHLSRLQAQAEPGTVRICESSSGGVPFSLLSWNGKPLEWLFEAPERIIVVEGRLSVSGDSGVFELNAGEFRDMPAGMRATFSGAGPVSCKLVACS